VRGYTGGDVRGYTGGDVRGYTGGDVRGYTGGDVAPRGYGARADCKAFGDGFTVAAMGPIESIVQNGDAATLVILGQAFEIPVADSAGFALGDFAVAGKGSANGATVYHVGSVYVAGVSGVRLKAPVTAVDGNLGTASLGAATVNYTALLSADPGAVPEVGESLAIAGTQPVARGLVLAGPSTGGTVGCSGP